MAGRRRAPGHVGQPRPPGRVVAGGVHEPADRQRGGRIQPAPRRAAELVATVPAGDVAGRPQAVQQQLGRPGIQAEVVGELRGGGRQAGQAGGQARAHGGHQHPGQGHAGPGLGRGARDEAGPEREAFGRVVAAQGEPHGLQHAPFARTVLTPGPRPGTRGHGRDPAGAICDLHHSLLAYSGHNGRSGRGSTPDSTPVPDGCLPATRCPDPAAQLRAPVRRQACHRCR